MARTQAADYDEKRESITAHAAELFALKGFGGASISDLAERCSVSKALIYHYYDSKEAILFDVMNSHIDDLLAVLDLPGDKARSPQDEFRLLTRELLRRYVGAASHQKVLLYELGSLPPEARKDIVQKQRKIIARIEDLYSLIKPALRRKRGLLRAKVMLYFGMLNWTHTWFKTGGEISRDDLADIASDMALGSL